MSNSVLWSDTNQVLAVINPASYTTAQETNRVKADGHEKFVAKMHVGAIAASGTLDFKLRQHNAASSGTSKDITGKVITQLTQAGSDSNKIRIIELDVTELDIANGYLWISALATPATAASILNVELVGCDPRFSPVSQLADVAVVN